MWRVELVIRNKGKGKFLWAITGQERGRKWLSGIKGKVRLQCGVAGDDINTC